MATEAAVPEATARRIGLPQGMDRALGRVRSRQGEVVGSGFLVDTDHVVTCTHVVLRALGRADRDTVRDEDTVTVDFPLVAPDVLLSAEMAVSRGVEADGGDVTVLSLTGELPPGLEPARLIVADDVWGHPFRAFGYPRRLDQGVWAAGVLRAPQGDGWVQMEAGGSGYPVEGGFSGGAVWDDELAGVVGMTVAADARPDQRAAFLIPSSTLIRAWPELGERTLPPCPYRGLYPFRSSDTELFFGREDVTDLLVREAVRRPLLAVVGPSGSGKSSVVSAGVVPRLSREKGWMSVSMRPAQASSPLFALAAAFIPVLEPDLGETERLSAANALVAVLRDGRLADVVDRVLARAQLNHLLLVVDQMEELFAREQDEVSAFVCALLLALQQGDGSRSRSLTVLLTLRADFLGNALQNSAFAGALEDSVITIGQMRRDQLRAVIEGPLPTGVRYEAGLVERILGDVGDEPGSLPLLEFALTLLWERQQDGLLTHRAYQELGGVDGALASYAERVYSDQLLPEDQEEVRRLFVQLVRPTEVGSSVRRVARRAELGEPRWQLGQRLAATRLLVADRDAAGAESVELVHEALIDGWTRLQQWTKADLAFRAWQEQLRAAVAAWESVRQDPGGLLRGAPLAEAERWQQERPNDLGETERRFIHASQARRGRSVRRLRITVAGLTVLLLLATALGVFAMNQSKRLSEQATLAGSRLLVGQAQQLGDYQPDVAMLLAAAAYRVAQTPETVSAVTRMATRERQVDRLVVTGVEPILSARFDPINPNKIVLYGPSTIAVWDAERSVVVRQWRSEVGIEAAASSADGRVIAVRESDGDLVLWWPEEDRTIPIGANVPNPANQIRIGLSPDGARLAVCDPKQIQVWDTGSRGLHAAVEKNSETCEFGLVDDGVLTYVDEEAIVKWDLLARRATARADIVPPESGSINSRINPELAIVPSGEIGILKLFIDGSSEMMVWDLKRMVPLGDLDDSVFGDVSFTRDGRWAAVGYNDNVSLVEVASRKLIKSYSRDDGDVGYNIRPGPPGGGSSFSLSADAQRLAIPTGGNSFALIRTSETADLPAVEGQRQIAVLPGEGGRFVVFGSQSANAIVQSMPGGAPVAVRTHALEENSNPQEVLSPDGRHAAVYGEQSGELNIVDATGSNRPPIRIATNNGQLSALAFDPEGEILALADASMIRLWSVDGGIEKAQVRLKSGKRASGVAVNREGTLVGYYDSSGESYVAEVASGETLRLPVQAVRSLSFSPDGKWIGVRTDTDVQVWDAELRRERYKFPGIEHFGTQAPRFSPDSKYVIAPRVLDGYDRISVWRVDGGQLVGEVAGSSVDAAFLPGGTQLVVADLYGLTTANFEPSSAINAICTVVGRDLTDDEWTRYAEGLERRRACP